MLFLEKDYDLVYVMVMFGGKGERWESNNKTGSPAEGPIEHLSQFNWLLLVTGFREFPH